MFPPSLVRLRPEQSANNRSSLPLPACHVMIASTLPETLLRVSIGVSAGRHATVKI
jgi:hypothetical protein